MLVFLHKYLLIKLMNNNILKNKLKINKNIANICMSNNINYYLYKYFDIKVLNNYINLNFFINFFIKILSNHIKPYLILSKTFLKTQLTINNYIGFTAKNSKIDFLIILNNQINSRALANLKKLNLPTFIVGSDVNKKYFDYCFKTIKNNCTVEYFIIEFFTHIYLSLKNEELRNLKRTYLSLNNINILKKNV